MTPYARQMNQPLALLASIVASATLLSGCAEPPADNPSTSKPSSQKPKGAEGPDPDRLPIAYQDDGKTLRECREWKSLGDDLQHGMAFRAIAESEMGPVTEAKIESVRRVIDTDCAENPKDVLWNVAVRGALLL